MTGLIQRITEAIFKQEGMPANYHNPGNLRDAPWFAAGKYVDAAGIAHFGRVYPDTDPVLPLAYASGFWVPRSRKEGIAGVAHVVALHIAKGESLRQLISIWAPPSDNNDTEAYIEHVREWAGITSADAPLWDYIDSVAGLAPPPATT